MLLDSNKTKIARRVIEVFEYFDQDHRTVTVMDIVRRYGRPQSSTSELLCSLVEMGLLYKDPRSRAYRPTPRLAVMGASAQPPAIQGGRLFAFMDDLARSTRHGVALFGMVGAHVQIFHWSPAPSADAPALLRGRSELLSASAAGHLLLSTLDAGLAGRLLRRLNAEAPQGGKFSTAELGQRIALYGSQGHVTGVGGFLPGSLVTAALVPCPGDDRPLALGFLYPEHAAVDPQALVGTLRRGIAACAAEDQRVPSAPFMIAV